MSDFKDIDFDELSLEEMYQIFSLAKALNVYLFDGYSLASYPYYLYDVTNEALKGTMSFIDNALLQLS